VICNYTGPAPDFNKKTASGVPSAAEGSTQKLLS
jgi:hypothetical protein